MGKISSEFKWRHADNIGAPDAEMDEAFLKTCFVDTGALGAIEEPADPQVVVLGRTGAGKSALLQEILRRHDDRAIVLQPDQLAISAIANSQILRWVAELEVSLDPFFKLLWRHVFVVELLKKYSDHHADTVRGSDLLSWFAGLLQVGTRDRAKTEKALNYLKQWGDSFWEETDYRIKEITSKFEDEIKDSLKASAAFNGFGVGSDLTDRQLLSEEQKVEVKSHVQPVISRAQAGDLAQVIASLGQLFSNKQAVYYILIDQLDEDWAENALRYRLIKNLVYTAREFVGVPNVKVIIALRRDLLERVCSLSRDGGFQEEKLAGNCLPLFWSKSQICTLLDRRVAELIARRYTKAPVGLKDILPEKYEKLEIDDAIYRLAPRPRDAISLLNCCIHAAIDKFEISKSAFSEAVGEYSRLRLRALADEWFADYPHLQKYVRLFSGRPGSFTVATVKDAEVNDLCLDVVAEVPNRDGGIHSLACAVVDGSLDPTAFAQAFVYVSYKIGLVGLKVSADSRAVFRDERGQSVSRGEISPNTGVVVSPMYRRALGVAGAADAGGLFG